MGSKTSARKNGRDRERSRPDTEAAQKQTFEVRHVSSRKVVSRPAAPLSIRLWAILKIQKTTKTDNRDIGRHRKGPEIRTPGASAGTRGRGPQPCGKKAKTLTLKVQRAAAEQQQQQQQQACTTGINFLAAYQTAKAYIYKQ